MARGSRAAKAKDAPARVWPKNTPEWLKLKCGLCGADEGEKCRDLASATAGALGAVSVATGQKRAPLTYRHIKEPHAARVRAGEAALAAAQEGAKP